VTDHYIYAVFHGQSFKTITQIHEKGEIPEDGGHYLYVFDHAGNPIKKYILDHAIYSIAIDEASGTVIATDVNSDSPIIAYKLPLETETTI
jgi:hypothetical protein